MRFPKLRRFFHIHLLTAVALMLVGGGLLWMNVHSRFRPTLARGFSVSPKNVLGSVRTGWPWRFRERYGHLYPEYETMSENEFATAYPFVAKNPDVEHIRGEGLVTYNDRWHWRSQGIRSNLAVALAILLVTAFVFECLLRRRRRPINDLLTEPSFAP